jgi:hypothetical protein
MRGQHLEAGAFERGEERNRTAVRGSAVLDEASAAVQWRSRWYTFLRLRVGEALGVLMYLGA